MFKLKFCCIILICAYQMKICCAQPGHPAQPHQNTGLAPIKCSPNSQSVGIVFPFMDMEIRNEHRIHMLLEAEQQMLFVLHGHELFQLHISREQKTLINLGTLAERRVAGFGGPLGASIVAWREYLLLAVALEGDVIAIYQLPKAQHAQRVNDAIAGTGAPLRFQLIQELTLTGKFRQMHLIKPTERQVFLLLAINMTKHQDKYRTFEWQDTYFNPVEELTVPTIQTLHVVGKQPKYIVSSRALHAQAKLVLTVYQLDAVTMKLQQRQALTVQARHVQAFTFHRRNYLICCASATSGKCIYFHMHDGNFVVYRKHILSDMHFKHVTADARDKMIVAGRSNGDVLIFNNAHLDCFNGFGTNTTHLIDSFVLHTLTNETFVIFSDSQASRTSIRMAEVYTNDDGASLAATLDHNEDLSVVQQHRHEFEESVNTLRSLLLRRKSSLDALHSLTKAMQQGKLSLQQPLTVQGGHINTVRLTRPHLSTPTQLLTRIERLRLRYGVGKRVVRSFGVGNSVSNSTIECLKVRRLHVENLIYNGDLLPGYSLEATASPAILTVKHKLVTEALHAPQLLTPHKYEAPPMMAPTKRTAVQNLWVQHINNDSWLQFYESLFLKSRDSTIEGRLIMQAEVAVENLMTPLLNGMVVQKLFNLIEPQTISSNIFMSAFFAWQMEAAKVNGLNFAEEIAFRSHNETLIKTPVHIYTMNVTGDMQISNSTKLPRLAEDGDATTPLQQYYTGKVTLHGTLTVNNLQRDTANARMLIAGQSLSKEHLAADFMLLRTPQNITTPVVFGYAKVTAPALTTATINNQPTEQHLLSGGRHMAKPTDKPLFLMFVNSSVAGDIVCRNFESQLAMLAHDAVYHGKPNNITGIKRMRAQLTTVDMWTQHINSLPTADLLLKSQLEASAQRFSSRKSFAHIEVTAGVNVSAQLNVSRLNSLLLEQLLNNDYSVDRLQLRHKPTIENLVFRRLNGIAADELLAQLTISDNGRLKLQKELLIQGNVRFDHQLQLQTINNVDWPAYQQRLVRQNVHTHIAGKKTFLSDVSITGDLRTPNCNGLDLSDWLDNTLLRSTPQAITGAYTLGYLNATNMDVSSINGVPASAFIDVQQPNLTLYGDIYATELLVQGNMSCPLAIDPELTQLNVRLQALQGRQWRNLVVQGDAFWNDGPTPSTASQARFAYLRKHAVTRSGAHTINGYVQLQAPQVLNMETNQQKFPAELDFAFIAEDALLRNSPLGGSQRVTAPLTLLRLVQTFGALRVQDTQFELLNDIDIARLNASLYRVSSGAPIVGPLSFTKPPIMGRLLVGGLLNGQNTTGLYQQGTALLEPVQMSQLCVEQNLMLGDINSMSLDYLLQNRIVLQGPAMEVFDTLSFEHLVLGKQPMLVTINDMLLDNVVYKHGQKVQTITGAKTVPQGVVLEGPAHVMWLNGKDLSDSYQQSIFTDKDYIIDSLVIGQASFQGGLVELPEATASQSRSMPEEEHNTLNEQLQDIESQAKNYHNARLLYMDYEPATLMATSIAAMANETYDLSVDMDLLRQPQSADCTRSFRRAQISQRLQLVHLSNVTGGDVLQAATDWISVKAHNHCGLQSHQMLCKLSIDCRQQARKLGIKKHVASLELLDTAVAEHKLLLLNALDAHSLDRRHNEVRVLAINAHNCSISDWQSLATAAGSLMKPLTLGNRTLLLTSGLHAQQPTLAVYQLQPRRWQFVLQQLIYGDYDMAELVQLPTATGSDYQLLLSCRRSNLISIHSYDAGTQKFTPLQQIRLSENVQALQTFTLPDDTDARYLLVLTAPGSEYYYIFSYAHIEGWVQKFYGHLGQMQWAWPLLDKAGKVPKAADTPLLLLCGENRCGLVRTLLA